MTTAALSFYGASDDCVEVEGARSNEWLHYHGVWTAKLEAPDGQALSVFAYYDGVWGLGIGQVDEDTPLPDWKVDVGQYITESGGMYSTLLTVHAPVGTTITPDKDES